MKTLGVSGMSVFVAKFLSYNLSYIFKNSIIKTSWADVYKNQRRIIIHVVSY